MRVGADGTESTIKNALSEHRAFALTAPAARAICKQVADIVATWQEHFERHNVPRRDIEHLVRGIDREFLYRQRRAV